MLDSTGDRDYMFLGEACRKLVAGSQVFADVRYVLGVGGLRRMSGVAKDIFNTDVNLRQDIKRLHGIVKRIQARYPK